MHSPAWSQIGQSSGWLMSRNSITSERAFLASSESVRISIPSEHVRLQATVQGNRSFGCTTSTWQMRQLPAMERPGCQQ